MHWQTQKPISRRNFLLTVGTLLAGAMPARAPWQKGNGRMQDSEGPNLKRRGKCQRFRLVAGYSEWRLTAAETGGQYCVIESLVPAGTGVPVHRHADQEAFYVLEGALEFATVRPSGVEWFSASEGDSVNAPSNEFHGFRNVSTRPARLLVMATAGLAAFFEEAGTPLEPGALAAGPPSPGEVERVVAIARKHGHVFLKQN